MCVGRMGCSDGLWLGTTKEEGKGVRGIILQSVPSRPPILRSLGSNDEPQLKYTSMPDAVSKVQMTDGPKITWFIRKLPTIPLPSPRLRSSGGPKLRLQWNLPSNLF